MNWKNAILALALILALGFLIWLLVEKSRSSDLARDMERLRTSLNQTSDQLSDTRRERDQLSRQITDKDREISQLRTDNERVARTARQRANSLQREVDSLRHLESGAQAAIDQHRLAAEAAATELAAAQSRLAELEKRLEGLTDSLPASDDQALLVARTEAQTKIESLTDNLNQARAENEKLRREAEAAGRELAAARNQAQAKATDQAPAENLLENELKTSRNQAADAVEKAKADVARLEEELSRAVKSEREARARLADCQRDTAGHQARIESLEKEKSVLRDSVSTVFVDQLLFNSGSVTLSGAGMEVLEAAARVVNQSPDRAVLVVGHSDDQAPNRQLSRYYPSNWELSAARAAAVVRHLTEKGGVDPARLSLVGRSHYQPAVPNVTAEDRQKNRRVEVIISNRFHSAEEAR